MDTLLQNDGGFEMESVKLLDGYIVLLLYGWLRAAQKMSQTLPGTTVYKEIQSISAICFLVCYLEKLCGDNNFW